MELQAAFELHVCERVTEDPVTESVTLFNINGGIEESERLK